MLKLENFGNLKTVKLKVFLFFAEIYACLIKPFEFVHIFVFLASFLRRYLSVLCFQAVEEVCFLFLINVVQTFLHIGDQKWQIFIHEIGLIKKSAVPYYLELVKPWVSIDCLIVEDECIYDIVEFAGTPWFVFGVEVLIDGVDAHVFADTEWNKKDVTWFRVWSFFC